MVGNDSHRKHVKDEPKAMWRQVEDKLFLGTLGLLEMTRQWWWQTIVFGSDFAICLHSQYLWIHSANCSYCWKNLEKLWLQEIPGQTKYPPTSNHRQTASRFPWLHRNDPEFSCRMLLSSWNYFRGKKNSSSVAVAVPKGLTCHTTTK